SHVIIRPNLPIRSRIRRERHQLDHVREIRCLRSAGVGMQLALNLTAGWLRQPHGNDGVTRPDAKRVHRTPRIRSHTFEPEVQSVPQNRRSPGAEFECLSERELGWLSRVSGAAKADNGDHKWKDVETL